MENVVIVASCRTPIGTIGGQFKSLTSLDLSIPVMQELVKRAGIDPAIIADVIWGCNYQRTYLENNLARVAAVKAGLPDTVPGITIHRNCTSSMSSIQLGYYQIKAGEADCIMAGGADSMSTAPHMVFDARYGKKFGHLELRDSMWDSLTNLGVGPGMGMTAENVAEKCGISREAQDELALLSQQRAVAAIDAGRFKEEIVPISIKSRKGETVYDTDEYPKRDVTLESLAKLKPTFKEGGTVTAGNASGMNDGASGVILMSESKAKELGIKPLAKILSVATTGIAPEIMGLGPVGAAKAALGKAGLELKDIGLVELNEAFAAQYLGCEKEMGLDRSITNVNGSGISMGHPVGATGSRITLHLINEMARRGVKYGLATLCAGGGMGTAVVVERS
ncbi:MAG: thiolase family protein [Clostridiales Family XIII bacterium]|jgi:acetyl-CoA C-acetyltransferase|nr:thiolase family protein [Clostridiales Family XIII bacterium]